MKNKIFTLEVNSKEDKEYVKMLERTMEKILHKKQKASDSYHKKEFIEDEEEMRRQENERKENGEKGVLSDKVVLEKYNESFGKEIFTGNNGKCETCNERDICLNLDKEYKWCEEK